MRKARHALAAGCCAAVVSAIAAGAPAEPNAELLGVPVRSLWQAANFLNPNFLTHDPVFLERGGEFVGTASLRGLTAANDQPIELEIRWTVSVLESNSQSLRASFSVPKDARYLVSAHVQRIPARGQIDTYSVVSVRSGKLVPQHLGYRSSEGATAAGADDLARGVFASLGIEGPFTNRIALHQ